MDQTFEKYELTSCDNYSRIQKTTQNKLAISIFENPSNLKLFFTTVKEESYYDSNFSLYHQVHRVKKLRY